MTPKAICFFDLDGTLLNEVSKVNDDTAQAIRKLKENNILPVIASGRSPFEVRDIMAKSNIDSMIGMNGQIIEIEGEILYDSRLSKEECDGFRAIADSKNQQIVYYNNETYWTSSHSDTMEIAYQSIHQELPNINDDKTLLEKVNLLLVILEATDDYDAYKDVFPELTFFRNNPNILDVVSGENNKGTGVKHILELLNLDIPTYAFGDGPNDFDLFHACDHKIAMGNAIDELKEIATFVTDANTEGGIEHALKHFNLI